jgi:hypothetical protein
MLPNTITVNAGSPAADIIYSGIQRDGNTVTYSADSPQGDLAGTRTMKFAAEQTSKGIVRSLVQVKIPVYDGTKALYVGEVTAQITINRPATVAKTVTALALEIIREAIAQTDVAAAIVDSRH